MQRLAKTRGVRGAAGWCASAALLYLLTQGVMELLISTLMGLRVPGASLSDPVGYTPAAVCVLHLLVGIGAIALPVLFLLYATRLRTEDLRILLPQQWSPGFCLGLFLGLANLANLIGGLLGYLIGTHNDTTLPEGGLALVISFLLLCVLPAVGEELLFRGALQGLLRPGGSAAAILGPALLFALLHLDLPRCVTALACGLFLGWLAERTGSILPGMLLHLVNNALAFLDLYLRLYAPTPFALAVEVTILLGLPVVGAVLLWSALQQGFRFDTGLRAGPNAQAVFTSPVYTLVVIFLCGCTLYLSLGGAL